MYGRISGIFIKDNMVYAIDSESGPLNHVNWRNGVRIGPLDEDRITAFIPPFEAKTGCTRGRLAKAWPSTPTGMSTQRKGRTRSTKREARSPGTP